MRQHEELYDFSNKKYSDAHFKAIIWKEIGETLNLGKKNILYLPITLILP